MSNGNTRGLGWMRGYHLVMTFVWPALAIPTAIWWKSSVLWVAILSLYANFASEFSAWHASKAQEQSEGGDNGKKQG